MTPKFVKRFKFFSPATNAECYGTNFIYHTHSRILPLQLYSGGEQPTPREEAFTASVSRVENYTPKLTGEVYLC